MAYEVKDFSGSLFKNTRKTKETHPDITGKAKIRGVMYYVSGWRKESRDQGKPGFYSLSFKPVDEAQQAPARDDSSFDDIGPDSF